MKVRPRTKHCCCYQGLQENAGMKSQQYSARMGQLAVSRTQCTFFSIYDTPLYGRGCTHGPKFVKHSAVYPKVLFSLESADTMSRKSNITNLFCFTGLLLTEEVSVLPAAGDVHCWWCGVSLCSLHQERCFLFIAYFSQSQWSDPDGNHLFGSVWTKPHPLGKFPSVSLQAWQKFGSIVEFLALQLSNNLFQHSGFALGLNFRKYSGQSSLYTNCFFFFYINMKIKQM